MTNDGGTGERETMDDPNITRDELESIRWFAFSGVALVFLLGALVFRLVGRRLRPRADQGEGVDLDEATTAEVTRGMGA